MSGKTFRQDTRIQKIFKYTTNQSKVFFKNNEVFSSGHDVAYHIDVNNVVYLEIEDETDAISQAPVATKAGWTLVGWRADATANPAVLPSYIVQDDSVHLYAVFMQQLTITYYMSGRVAATDVPFKYYNNGSYRYPAVTLQSVTEPGWTLVGYRNDTSPDQTVPYYAGNTDTFTQNTTIYAVLKQTVTMRVLCKGTTYTYPRTRYANNGNYNNPVVYFDDQTLDDAVFQGYSSSISSVAITIATLSTGFTLTQDTYFYAVWRYNDALLFESPDPYNQTIQMWMTHTGQYVVPSRDGNPFEFNGIKYATVSVTLRASADVAGWATQNNVWIYMYDAQSTWILHAGRGSQQGTWEEGPCADGQVATVEVVTTQQNPTYFTVDLSGDLADHSEINISKLYGNGRTLVY